MLLGISCNYQEALTASKKYNVLQLNIGNLNDVRYPEDEELEQIPDFNIPIFIHSKICYNISKKNINYSIKKEMMVLKHQTYGRGIVIHLSKWYKSKREEALEDVVEKLQILIKNYDARIILETSYHINSLGSNIDDFAYILKRIKGHNVSICLDTSHLYLTGHPVNRPEYILEYLTEFEIKIGLKRISLIHLNDIESTIFGKHTPHLDIGEGLIFKDPNVLNYFVTFAKYYNIPIILERNALDDNIYKNEIDKINNSPLLFKNEEKFDIFLKNSIVLYFINKLLEYYEIMGLDDSELRKTKTNIFNSYKNGDHKLIKINNKYTYNFSFEYQDKFEKILNEDDYHVFDYLFLEQRYLNIKELLNIPSIGRETLNHLLEVGIDSLDKLKDQTLAVKKKLLTPFQQKVITNHKFIRFIDFDSAHEIVQKIKQSYNHNIHFYGSYYRILNGVEEPRMIKDIDLLCVGDPRELITILKSLFVLKVELYMGDEKKSYVFLYKKIYFTLELYICKENELPFMSIYLKGPVKQVKKIYSIAKAKGYKMNNKSLTKDGKRIYFDSDIDVLKFLNIKPIISR